MSLEELAKLNQKELIDLVMHLTEVHDDDQYTIDGLRDNLDELEDELADYQAEYMGLEKYQDGEWINVDDLIYRLKLENLYDDKMEKFIEDYIKWYNN